MDKEIHISVINSEQLNALLCAKNRCFSRIYVDYSIAESFTGLCEQYDDIDFYITSPYVVRNDETEKLERILISGRFKGVLVRNMEIFSFLNMNADKFGFIKLVLDSNMYVLNHEALDFYIENSKLEISEFYCSLELNEHENAELTQYIGQISESFLVYGRIPMMISANCVRKTTGKCSNNSGFTTITDRYQKDFPVYCNCLSCYNVIYNSVVLSLHKQFGELIGKGNVRIDFTTENGNDVNKVIDYFGSLKMGYREPVYTEFTTGHFKRGVE